MKAVSAYLDLDGMPIALDGLDADERRLLARLALASALPKDW